MFTAVCTSANTYSEYLTIVVHRGEIADYEACAEEIIERCIDNDFQSIKFSYDRGYPNEVQATVYLTEEDIRDGEAVFKMSYRADSIKYNIKDHAEEFRLEITEP